MDPSPEQEMKIAMLSCDPCKIIREVFKSFPGAYNYNNYMAKRIDSTRRIARTHEPRRLDHTVRLDRRPYSKTARISNQTTFTD